ncbi:MAG TPA: MotA/TolQ/ExbB proton channel family protein [Fimbriiglobus sp.]|jgi:biopolymer transport protein ExbB|nr:MotA/TolQ/ExbB proton channel family protein [Fimbriiglobus sp.]
MNPSSSRLVPYRRALLLLALFALLLTVGPALAQEAGEAAPAPAPTAAAASHDNIFVHIIKSVGFFWIVLLPLSIWLIAIVVLLALDLRMGQAIPAGFVDDFTDTVNKRRFKEAYDLARSDPSYLGRVLTAGMSRLQYGLDDARESAFNALEGIKSDKEQKNNYTAVIATLGPLLGLVGTVFGMIEAFMALSAGTAANPTRLAAGISHALAVTLVGIAISVPAIAFNTYFRNRITQLALEVGHVADDLLTQMYHNSKKPGVPTSPPTGSVPVAAATPVAAAPVAPPPR